LSLCGRLGSRFCLRGRLGSRFCLCGCLGSGSCGRFCLGSGPCASWCWRRGRRADRSGLIAHCHIYPTDLWKRQSGRISTGGIFVHAAHLKGGSARQSQMKLTATRPRTGCRSILLIGILAVAGFIGAERATVIPRILVLNTGLIGYHCITRGIEGHAVQEGIEGRRTCPT